MNLALNQPLRWAVVGPGRIAHKFAAAVAALPGHALVAVHSRSAERGQAFAETWTKLGAAPPAVHTELSTLLASPVVDAVYVATPHAQHGAAVRASLLAGKPVLCEKSLVPTRAEAAELVALAQARGVFLMEAVWTRFLPLYATIGRWLREGAVGPVQSVQSCFCFPAPYLPEGRLFNPALAGGALLDIGIYNLTVTRWVMAQAQGTCPPAQLAHLHGQLAPTGVDLRVAGTLQFEGGALAQFVCGLDGQADNALRIQGARGHILVPHNFWQATAASLHRRDEAVVAVEAPFSVNGFEGEIEEAARCIRAGAVESALMPHSETLATLGWLDEMRHRLGVRYPFE